MSKTMLSIVLLCSCATPAKPAESEAAEKIAIPPKNTTYPIFVEAETAEEEALNSEEQKRVDENCLGGAPKKLKSFGATTVIGRREYALEHSSTRKIALWVCEHLTKEEVITEVAHRSIKCGTKAIQLMKFFPDPRLEAGKRAELADYEGYGYDRGHMAPSDDFQSRWGAMEESFYLSNMAPQVGQGFNRSVWAKLEGHVRDYAEKYGEAWVFTGGFYKPNDVVYTIGNNEVYVPTWFYKIVVVKQNGTYDAFALVFANKKHANTSDFQKYAVKIDQVEDWSGIDFMTGLPSNVSSALEGNVADLSQW